MARRAMGVTDWRREELSTAPPSSKPMTAGYLPDQAVYGMDVERILRQQPAMARLVMEFLYVRPHLTGQWLPPSAFGSVVAQGFGSEVELAMLDQMAKKCQRKLARFAVSELGLTKEVAKIKANEINL